MSGLSFTKLSSSITASSVWQESDQTRIVWITMLAMGDQFGRIHASIPGLAHIARVSIADTEKALAVFLAPDPYSRNKESDGRRIEEMVGGWKLINYKAHRERRDPESRREQNKEAAARKREKEKNSQPIVSQNQPESATSANVSHESAYAEAEAEAEAESTSTVSSTSYSHPGASLGAITKPHPDLSIYESYPRKEGKGAAMTAISKAVARLVKGEAPHPPMVKIDAQRYLMRRVLEYERSPVGRQTDKTMIPHPATWFNQKRYDDDQTMWHRTETSNGNRNSKTGGNLDAAAAAFAILERQENDLGMADEVCGEAGSGSGADSHGHLRGGLIDLRP